MEKIEIQQISRQWVNDVMDVNEANAEDVFEESEDHDSDNENQRRTESSKVIQYLLL